MAGQREIDVVITWVDGADSEWLNEKKKYSASVRRAWFLSSGLSPAMSRSRSSTSRSPVSKSGGRRFRRKEPAGWFLKQVFDLHDEGPF